MPYYMDRHDLTAASAADVAAVHLKDLEVQERHGVQFVNYWFDYELQHAFCLAQAPNVEAVETVHRESHGLLPRQIIRVDTAVQLAARLSSKAPARTILAAGVVRELAAGSRFELGANRRFRLKGFGEAVKACEVVWRPV